MIKKFMFSLYSPLLLAEFLSLKEFYLKMRFEVNLEIVENKFA